MDKPAVVSPHALDEDGGAVDIELLGHRRVEFARFQGAVPGAIENGAEAVGIEQRPHAGTVLGVEGDDVLADETPRLTRSDADDAPRVAPPEVVEGVEPRHSGNTRDEQRQAGHELSGIDEHGFRYPSLLQSF